MRAGLLSTVMTMACRSLAYPIMDRQCDAWQTWPGQVYSFDPFLAQVRFTFPPHDTLSPGPPPYDKSLVFSSYVLQCSDPRDLQCRKIILNHHEIASSDTTSQSRKDLTLTVDDVRGDKHTVAIAATPNASLSSVSGLDLSASLTAKIEVLSIDGRETHNKAFLIAFNTSESRSSAILSDTNGGMVVLQDPQSYCTVMSVDGRPAGVAEEAYIADEIEAIQLLEQDVDRLQQEISARKNAASVRLARYHSHVPLDQLMQRCDGIVCTAKAIANRIYEKITLAVDSNNRYEQLQSPVRNDDADITGGKESLSSNLSDLKHSTTDLLLRALTCLASLLGLVTLFAYIRRKCMSVRKQTERAADLEERRNARAYRCAARREKMRRRWSAVRNLFTFCRHKDTQLSLGYDEKRAMILQDALLEQHPEHLAKGDIMEAEIRQLRHARSLVSGIVRVDSVKAEDTTLVKDPPPTLVPLPYSTSRSRSSTNTLPSYDSDSLPDYSSLPDEAELGIHVCDGFAQYSPPSDIGSEDMRPNREETGVVRAPASISSIAALSPRASNETLRTRTTLRSRAGSHELSR